MKTNYKFYYSVEAFLGEIYSNYVEDFKEIEDLICQWGNENDVGFISCWLIDPQDYVNLNADEYEKLKSTAIISLEDFDNFRLVKGDYCQMNVPMLLEIICRILNKISPMMDAKVVKC